MDLTRLDRRPVKITVRYRGLDGTIASPSSVQLAVLPVGTGPSASTAWVTVAYAAGALTVVAGPDADQSLAVGAGTGGVLWGLISVNGNPVAFPIEEVRLV